MPERIPELSTVSDKCIPTFSLDSTHQKGIPRLDFGTAEYPFASSLVTTKEAVLQTIKQGYRHFDTAVLYQSEQTLGEAMEECQELGLKKWIGVSTFSCKKLQTILSTTKIQPMVNQVVTLISTFYFVSFA
ncbi:hypothetical protein REPUB_Repub04eG0220400 [Reevesia pubescens]